MRQLGAVAVLIGAFAARAYADGSVQGRLVDESGQPIADGLVSVLVGGELAGSVTTESDGRFRFAAVPAGVQGLIVQKHPPAGMDPAFGYECPAAAPLKRGLAVIDGRALDLGDLAVVRSGFRLRVSVFEGDRPVAGAEVAVWTPGVERREPPMLDTASDGTAEFSVSLDPRAPTWVCATPVRDGEPWCSAPLRVRPRPWDTISARIDVSRDRVRLPVVRVLAPDGTPVAGARLFLLAPDTRAASPWSFYVSPTTEADGRAAFSHLPSGSWRVCVAAPGLTPQVHDYPLTGTPEAPVDLRLRPGVSVTLTQSLSIGGSPIASLLDRARMRMGAGARTLPPLALYLLSEGSDLPSHMVPHALWATERLTESIVLDGVQPGRYRALLVPALELPATELMGSVNAAFPYGLRTVPERIRVMASGSPPLLSDPFEIPAASGARVRIQGDTPLSVASTLAGQLPPYVAQSESTLKSLIGFLGGE